MFCRPLCFPVMCSWYLQAEQSIAFSLLIFWVTEQSWCNSGHRTCSAWQSCCQGYGFSISYPSIITLLTRFILPDLGDDSVISSLLQESTERGAHLQKCSSFCRNILAVWCRLTFNWLDEKDGSHTSRLGLIFFLPSYLLFPLHIFFSCSLVHQ